MDLPQDFTINGTIRGNAGTLNTKMNVLTSDGNIAIDGTFSNFTNPAKAKYNGHITTNNLQLGKILRQQTTIGSVSGTVMANGQGLTPDAINTKFSAAIASAEYNHYHYRNVKLDGTLQKTIFELHGQEFTLEGKWF